MSHMDAIAEDELTRLRSALAAAEARFQQQRELTASREREVRALRRVALAMNSSLDLDRLLETIVEVALDLTGADRAHVVWRDEAELDHLLASRPGGAGWRLPDDALHKVEVCRQVLQTGEAAAASDARVICLPLMAPGRLLGALCVDGPLADEDAIADLHVLAAHAAVALENAVLFTALRRRSAELEATLGRFQAAELAAHTDPLTGIANKRQFEEQGKREEAASRRYGRPYSLIMADIDFFKTFNDKFGHLTGDVVLKHVASTLMRHVRAADLLARWGGEEFVVLCPMTTRREAAQLAERLRKAIAAQHVHDETGQPLPSITISLGVATYQGGDDPLDAVLERADRALLQAKGSGRNLVRVHDPDPGSPAAHAP